MILQFGSNRISLSSEEQTLLDKVCKKIVSFVEEIKENERVVNIIIKLNLEDDSIDSYGVDIAQMTPEQIYGLWTIKNMETLQSIRVVDVFEKKECLFFQKESINTLYDFAVRELSEKRILKSRNGVGSKGLQRMKEALGKRGFKIRDFGGIEKK